MCLVSSINWTFDLELFWSEKLGSTVFEEKSSTASNFSKYAADETFGDFL